MYWEYGDRLGSCCCIHCSYFVLNYFTNCCSLPFNLESVTSWLYSFNYYYFPLSANYGLLFNNLIRVFFIHRYSSIAFYYNRHSCWWLYPLNCLWCVRMALISFWSPITPYPLILLYFNWWDISYTTPYLSLMCQY